VVDSPEHDVQPPAVRPAGRTTTSLFARALFVVAAALLPLSVAWALSENGSGAEAGAAPSPEVTRLDPALRAGLAEASAAPAAAAARRSRVQDRLAVLRHPLVGVSRGELVRAIGRPTRRTNEGGAAMELLEYEIADDEYQVVVLNKRVVEVTRFR